jgi:hypothetical protein
VTYHTCSSLSFFRGFSNSDSRLSSCNLLQQGQDCSVLHHRPLHSVPSTQQLLLLFVQGLWQQRKQCNRCCRGELLLSKERLPKLREPASARVGTEAADERNKKTCAQLWFDSYLPRVALLFRFLDFLVLLFKCPQLLGNDLQVWVARGAGSLLHCSRSSLLPRVQPAKTPSSRTKETEPNLCSCSFHSFALYVMLIACCSICDVVIQSTWLNRTTISSLELATVML